MNGHSCQNPTPDYPPQCPSQRSDELLKLFIEHAPAALAMFDSDMRYLNASRRWRSDYGLGERELLGLSHYDVFPEISAEWKEVHRRGLAGEVLQSDGERFQRADGSVQWVRWEVRPWHEAAGQVGGVVIFAEDITARKQAEEALLCSELRERKRAAELAAVLDAVPAAVWIAHDPACSRITSNQVADRLLRQPQVQQASAEGERVFRVISNSTAVPDHELPVHVAARGTMLQDLEHALEFEDGTTRHLYGNALPLRDDQGQPRGAVAAFVDITRRNQAQQELNELTQRLNYHIDHLPLAVIEWGADMRLVRWSGSAEQIFGWTAEEMLGTRFGEFRWVPEDEQGRVAEVCMDLLKGIRRCSVNHNYRKDGTVICCEWYNSTLLDESGNLGSILSFVLDVTDRNKLEQALQYYSEMLESQVQERTAQLREKDRLLIQQSRLAAMGEMINNIAHQWRQPLNVLGLTIQRLSLYHDLGLFSRELLDTSVKDAMKLVQHMSQTIEDFRNFFKPDKEKVDFCVNMAIQETISLVQDAFDHYHIKIATMMDGEIPIHGYPREFSQVILNIMQNARDAIVERQVKSGVVRLASSVEDGRIVVTIADNAGGIPQEIIDAIFEPYFSTKGLQGTGIGLYMSKSIIETNMGGRISVRNIGEGAEFRIEV